MVKSILIHPDTETFNKLTKEKGDMSWEEFLIDNANRDWETIHTNIHALRLIKGYKPSDFEQKVGAIIVERFKNTCSECKSVSEKLKNQSTDVNKNNFWGTLING